MRRSLIVFLLFCSITFTAHMQDASPWPPNAADIFAPGIKVLQYDMLDKVQQTPSNEITIIPEARAIKGADGRVYPWPESISYFRFTKNPPIISYDELYLYELNGPQGDVNATWTLNLKTGVFAKFTSQEPPNSPCGKVWLRRMDWDSYSLNDQAFLCNPSSGQQIPFPKGYRIVRYQDSYEADPSIKMLPDGRLVVAARASDDPNLTILVYNPKTATFDSVGRFPFEGDLHIEIRSANLILFTFSIQAKIPHYGIFDPIKNTLSSYTPPTDDPNQITQWAFWPNPNIATFKRSANNTCSWVIYDLVTIHEQTLELGDLCDADYTAIDGTGYYRELSPDKKSATVMQFNPITGKRQEIYKGEIEGIEWVSADARYLILITDDSGKIDLIPGTHIGPNSPRLHGTLKLIDAQYGLTGFKTAAYINPMTLTWGPFVSQIAPNWLTVQHVDYSAATDDLLIHLSPDGIKIRKIAIQYRINDEWATYNDDSAIGLYHLEDDRRVPIFINPVATNYIINSLVPLGDGRFEVGVSYSNWPADDPPDQKTASFVVSIPDLDLPLKQNILQYAISSNEGVF